MLIQNKSFAPWMLVGLMVPAIGFAGAVNLRQGKDQIEVVVNGKPFTTYYFGSNVAKAYLMPLRTASGIIISRPFPVGNDVGHADPKASSFEPHQRPLYFAHGNIDGLNFWGEAAFQKFYGGHSHEAFGHMANARIESIHEGGQSGSIKASFALEDQNGRVIGEETQSYTFSGDERQRTIDCEFTLKADHGPMTLGDSKEGTFAVRLGPELSEPHVKMVNSRNGHGELEIWGKPADWVAYHGTVSGQPVSIALFDHPKSFRHPTTWHARAYGLLAANPFGLREFTNDAKKDGSWTIPEGGSVNFRYRVVIHDGDLPPNRIANLYRQYASVP
jgi:hypothetical protein